MRQRQPSLLQQVDASPTVFVETIEPYHCDNHYHQRHHHQTPPHHRERPWSHTYSQSGVLGVFCRLCCLTKERRIGWLVLLWLLVTPALFQLFISLLIESAVGRGSLAHNISTYTGDWRSNTLSQEWAPFLAFFLPNLVSKLVKKKQRHRDKKTILYANQYWDFDEPFQFGVGHQPFLQAKCPVSDCIAIQDGPALPNHDVKRKADAVIFHAAQFDLGQLPEIQKWRQPHQRFIFMTMESPLSSYHPAAVADSHGLLDNFFNDTMTYRLDSDFPRPYGYFAPIHANPRQAREYQFNNHPNFKAYNETHFVEHVLPGKPPEFHELTKRPKKVAWLVSRCESPSRREDYVRELQKYIHVDILGDCGLPCTISFHEMNKQQQQQQHLSDNCTLALQRDYKFVLSLENSFCHDYITEKFYRSVAGEAVVIVLGGGNYSQRAPSHSYIDALDYASPKALATELLFLDDHPDQYLSYFWWKDHYEVHMGSPQDHAQTMCQLCARLHDSFLPSKTYANIADWHGVTSQCDNGRLPKTLDTIVRALPKDETHHLEDDHVR